MTNDTMTMFEAMTVLMQAEEEKKAAEKRAKAAREYILQVAGDAETLSAGGLQAIIKRTPRDVIDTKRLYADFPDIKEVYGKTTVSRSVQIVRAEPEKATA